MLTDTRSILEGVRPRYWHICGMWNPSVLIDLYGRTAVPAAWALSIANFPLISAPISGDARDILLRGQDIWRRRLKVGVMLKFWRRQNYFGPRVEAGSIK